jgi:hypothetical protein
MFDVFDGIKSSCEEAAATIASRSESVATRSN